MIDILNEIWKDIKEYEGLYQISNLGKIKSLERISQHKTCYGGLYKVKEKMLIPVEIKEYKTVKLCKNGILKRFYLHRLVAETFIPNPLNKPEVNHKDGNKSNNIVENLEWMTHQENCKHRDDTGLRKAPKGIKHYLYGKHIIINKSSQRKVCQYDLNKNFIREWESIAQAQRKLKINNVGYVCQGKRNKAGGYIWKYKEGNNE